MRMVNFDCGCDERGYHNRMRQTAQRRMKARINAVLLACWSVTMDKQFTLAQ